MPPVVKASSIKMINRFRGCLIGSAIGDAMGMPVENMTRAQILKKFHGDINRFYPKPNRGLSAGQWTDDTLLTLTTVDSLIEQRALIPSHIAFKFRQAFESEGGRGFGASTKTALRRLQKGCPWKEAGADGKYTAGCGAAMRIAPIALFSYSDLDQLKRNCTMVASITHKNQEAINGSLAVAYIIARSINGKFDANTIISDLKKFIGPSEFSSKLSEINDVQRDSSLSVADALDLIGTSGSVFEAVGSSIYIFLRSISSFEEAIVSSVSYGGDTDSIGGMVGAMSGAYHGDAAIPRAWKNGVEAGDEIFARALDLYNLSHGIHAGKS